MTRRFYRPGLALPPATKVAGFGVVNSMKI